VERSCGHARAAFLCPSLFTVEVESGSPNSHPVVVLPPTAFVGPNGVRPAGQRRWPYTRHRQECLCYRSSVGRSATRNVVALAGSERRLARHQEVYERGDLVDGSRSAHGDAAHHVLNGFLGDAVQNLSSDHRR